MCVCVCVCVCVCMRSGVAWTNNVAKQKERRKVGRCVYVCKEEKEILKIEKKPEEYWCNKTRSDHKLLKTFSSIQAPVTTVLHSDPIDLVILSLWHKFLALFLKTLCSLRLYVWCMHCV